jgi:uncharacterized protein
MEALYPRWQKKSILKAMETRRVLLLSGPRQCGKTTLTQQLVSANVDYRTLDDPALRIFAQDDPVGFVKHTGKTLIIDEIQHVPELLSVIKMAVDRDTRPGQYLLTGSANVQSLPGVKESLAGRVRKLRLRPLSQGELLHAQPSFLETAFRLTFKEKFAQSYDRNDVMEMSFRGGFPEAIASSPRERRKWHVDYVNSLIERDLADISHIQRQDAMHELLKVLAAWSGKYLDIAAVGAGLSIYRSTVESYINMLEALYMVERVPPWTRTDYQRVGKQHKLFMTDSGLMASVLGWRIEQAALDSDRSGKIIETFVFNELMAQIDAADLEYRLFHYRDRERREIDFLIEREDGALLGIEVKAGSAMNTDRFKNLRWFKDNIARKKHRFTGIVLYTGTHAGSMGDNLWAVPFSALWSKA